MNNPLCTGFWAADAVFTGTAIEAIRENVGPKQTWTVTRIAVDHVFRGRAGQQITLIPAVAMLAAREVLSASSAGPETVSSSCDYRFEIGRRYLVYAKRTREGGLTTTRCAGTKPVYEAASDLEFITGMPAKGTTGHVYDHLKVVLSP